MADDYSKAPRLYIPDDLSNNGNVQLSRDHTHYLMNVMRKKDGDIVRIFNGRNGEYIAKTSIINKKNVELKWLEKIREQTYPNKKIHLYCPPIKKERFAFMIEKAVELGVTNIHPIITQRTQNAKINIEKCERYIIESTEQCERMDLPVIKKPIPIEQCNFVAPSYASIERDKNIPLFNISTPSDCIGLVVGPEGGWTNAEIDFLKEHSNVTAVSLGDNILRAETATIFMLSRIIQ